MPEFRETMDSPPFANTMAFDSDVQHSNVTPLYFGQYERSAIRNVARRRFGARAVDRATGLFKGALVGSTVGTEIILPAARCKCRVTLGQVHIHISFLKCTYLRGILAYGICWFDSCSACSPTYPNGMSASQAHSAQRVSNIRFNKSLTRICRVFVPCNTDGFRQSDLAFSAANASMLLYDYCHVET